MDYFEIHLVEHCNLKCKACDNYSSIAEEEYLDIENFENDMKRMRELFSGIQLIRLLGGEPLLHPDLISFLYVIRKYFKIGETNIRITTNAILLHKMPEEFWEACHKNNITIEYSYYPININRWEHRYLSERYVVVLIPLDWEYNEDKTSHRMAVTDNKNEELIEYNYNNCHRVLWKCISLKNGKIYPCSCIPNIYHFNKFFKKNLKVTENDYISIYDHTAEEIDDFLKHPVPFCGYCNVKDRQFDNKWEVTKYDISEWYDK